MGGFDHDGRIVMTLDAGGTNFRFSAIRGNQPLVSALTLPSNGNDLNQCLSNLVEGFTRIKSQCLKTALRHQLRFSIAR
ncbi:MAG: glucokinase [Pedosphaera sp.]|nr:glucokinase [Pedosphaera sp.]